MRLNRLKTSPIDCTDARSLSLNCFDSRRSKELKVLQKLAFGSTNGSGVPFSPPAALICAIAAFNPAPLWKTRIEMH